MKTRIQVRSTLNGTRYTAQMKRKWFYRWTDVTDYFDVPNFYGAGMDYGTIERAKAQIDFAIKKVQEREAYEKSIKVSYIDYP